MYSIVLPDEIVDPGIQGVLWTLLAIFFVMVILGWWIGAKNWFKEEELDKEKKEESEE